MLPDVPRIYAQVFEGDVPVSDRLPLTETPEIRATADGPDAITLSIPLPDTLPDPVAAYGLVWGRVVTLVAVDGAYRGGGSDYFGSSGTYDDGGVYGITGGRSRPIYRAQIERTVVTYEKRIVSVATAPIARHANLIRLPAALVVDGCPLTIARNLVRSYAGDVLTWHVHNPTACDIGGSGVSGVSLGGLTLREALAALAALAGETYLSVITPDGTVHMHPRDAEPTHTLGQHEIADIQLESDGIDRRNVVTVVYTGGDVTVEASGVTALTRRPESVTAKHITRSEDARRLARLELSRLNQMQERGSLTALLPYDLPSIVVGDTISFIQGGDGTSGTSDYFGSSGTYDDGGTYGSAGTRTPLVVASYAYDGVRSQISLSKPRRTPIKKLARAMRDIKRLQAG